MAQCLHKGDIEMSAALAASQGEQSMAKPHDTQNQEAFQEHPMVMELLAALRAIDERGRVEARFYELITRGTGSV
jgi:creatinine amidohydrolase/Fe(II)-dependent formamide hydrolase-like protein